MLTESRQVNTLDETSSHTGTSRHKLHDWPEGPNRALDGAAEDPAACQLRVPHCRRAQSCNLGSLFRWMRQTPDFGAKPLGHNRKITFSDFSYTEMVLDLEPGADAITLDSDPYVIIRPEGDWDRPGVLDISAGRAVTSPLRDTTPARA